MPRSCSATQWISAKGLDLIHDAAKPMAYADGHARWITQFTWPDMKTVSDRGFVYNSDNPTATDASWATQFNGLLRLANGSNAAIMQRYTMDLREMSRSHPRCREADGIRRRPRPLDHAVHLAGHEDGQRPWLRLQQRQPHRDRRLVGHAVQRPPPPRERQQCRDHAALHNGSPRDVSISSTMPRSRWHTPTATPAGSRSSPGRT